MRIVVLAGGTSTERDVSISSGLLVASALRKKGHHVVLLDVFTGYEKDILDVDELFKQNYSFTDTAKVGETISDIDEIRENRRDKTNRFIGENVIDICACADITFFALHGGEGENGQLQATFDLLGLKYTGSGYLLGLSRLGAGDEQGTHQERFDSKQGAHTARRNFQEHRRNQQLEDFSLRCQALLRRLQRRHHHCRDARGL